MRVQPDLPALPVTIVTGFLGSGKTTLVRRLLDAAGGRRIGVIVNEFGALGIDGALLAGGAETLIELPGGCLCCATQGDLLSAVARMVEHAPAVEHLLIETSGLAQPGPVAEGLATSEFARALGPPAIVTVVDALNFDRNLDCAEAAFGQISDADLLLVNKVDLVSPGVPALIEAGVRKLNPDAQIVHCTECRVEVETILSTAPGVREPLSADMHGHEMRSLALPLPEDLDRAAFERWAAGLTGVYRAKGLVKFAGDPSLYLFQKVGDQCSLEPSGANGAGDRALVLIGEAPDEQLLGSLATAMRPASERA